jgi:hypothetical protein
MVEKDGLGGGGVDAEGSSVASGTGGEGGRSRWGFGAYRLERITLHRAPVWHRA